MHASLCKMLYNSITLRHSIQALQVRIRKHLKPFLFSKTNDDNLNKGHWNHLSSNPQNVKWKKTKADAYSSNPFLNGDKP